MPNYTKSIVVDGNGFVEIISDFNSLVSNKFYEPVPYKDYTRLKKFNKEVEFRFCSSDGAVMIVPTEPTLSLLYWTKKGDESLGDFLWEHFQEELKEMNENDKIIDNTITYKYDDKKKYDLWGGYADGYADACASTSAKSVIDDLCSQYDWSKIATKDDNCATTATIAVDKLITPSISSEWVNMSDTVEQLKYRVEELGHMLQVNTDKLHAKVAELADTTTRSLSECYETMEAQLAKKVDIAEMEYRLEDRTMDILGELDGVHYDTKVLADRVCELEDNYKTADNKTTTPGIAYDMYGMPHEIQGVSTHGISTPNYPVKNYKINIKADYMSACDDRKEKENMDTNKIFNFDFGPVASHIRMSPYGLAMKNADGKYVSYDKATGSVMDVEIFNFDAQKFLYKMPVAVNQVAVGDIVVHMRKPMFVRAVKDGVVSVIDIYNAEAKDILPVKSPFGFNFITKVVSLIDMTGADANSPFGNMLPLLMLGEGQNFKDILPLMLFANGNNGLGNFAQNPLVMYALMKDGDSIGDVLPFLMLGQNGLFGQAPAHNCGCHNHEPERQCHNGN